MKTHAWTLAVTAILSSMIAASGASQPETAGVIHAPAYESDGRLQLPAQYREWIYLSTGFDMSYSPRQQAGHSMFDNVFVEPGARDKGSINQGGHYQSTELMGVEVHVKDTARFAGGWGFFAFDEGKSPATQIPPAASCYTCHAAHAAVDTTFVQFYPTLLPIATAKGTLSTGYQRELPAAQHP